MPAPAIRVRRITLKVLTAAALLVALFALVSWTTGWIVRGLHDEGARVGAVCADGWGSDATGQGACSYHQGVDRWLTENGPARVPAWADHAGLALFLAAVLGVGAMVLAGSIIEREEAAERKAQSAASQVQDSSDGPGGVELIQLEKRTAPTTRKAYDPETRDRQRAARIRSRQRGRTLSWWWASVLGFVGLTGFMFLEGTSFATIFSVVSLACIGWGFYMVVNPLPASDRHWLSIYEMESRMRENQARDSDANAAKPPEDLAGP